MAAQPRGFRSGAYGRIVSPEDWEQFAAFVHCPKEGRDVSGQASVKVRGTVRYQACFQSGDADRCLDPRETPFEAKIIVADN